MSRTRTRSALRRSLIVVLDGLAIAVLAVLMASYARDATLADGAVGLLAVAETTVRGWLATPGIGPFEGAALLGLAIVAWGVLWYGVGRPVLGRIRRVGEREPERDPVGGFEFGPAEAGATSARSGGRSPFAPPRSDDGQGSGSARWTQAVFDHAPAPSRSPVHDALAAGDFYRSSSRNDAVSVEADEGEETLTPADDGDVARPPADRPARADTRPAEDDPVEDAEPDDAPRAVEDEAASERLRAADEPTDDADPLGRLGDSVAEARGSLETVRAALSAVESDRPATAERALSATAAAADERLARLRTALPNGSPDPAESVTSIYDDGAELEATLEAALDGA